MRRVAPSRALGRLVSAVRRWYQLPGRMMTRAVNLRLEPYDVYIGRAGGRRDGYFGNPFKIGLDGNRFQVIEKYRVYFLGRLSSDATFRKRVRELKGKTLGCFCKPDICHGDVIVAYLDR